jgi:hypothetical protein
MHATFQPCQAFMQAARPPAGNINNSPFFRGASPAVKTQDHDGLVKMPLYKFHAQAQLCAAP